MPSADQGETLTADLRARLGVTSFKEFASRASELNVEGLLEDTYEHWLRTGPRPSRKPSGQLRPCHCPSTLSRVDELAFVTRGLLVADSVALVLPQGSYLYTRLVPLLAACEELIDSGLLVLIPERHVDPTPTLMKYFRRFAEELRTGTYRPDHDEDFAELEIAQSLDACSALEGRVDLGLTNRGQSRVLLEHLVEVEQFHQVAVHDELAFLPDFLSFDLPLPDLPVGDLQALRKDGYMANLRAVVRDATRTAVAADVDLLLDRRSTLRREFHERINDALEQEASAHRRSSLVRGTTGRSATFAVGVATGALGGVGGLEIGAMAGGLSVVGAALAEWFMERPSRGQRAYRRLLATISTPG